MCEMRRKWFYIDEKCQNGQKTSRNTPISESFTGKGRKIGKGRKSGRGRKRWEMTKKGLGCDEIA
jgi:hypothetical protein